MERLWYKDAIIYGIDISVFQDSDGDGMGDIAGVASRLEYLRDLGITCLWLLPFCSSPRCDNGYDITNYYSVDRQLGTFEDFLALLHRAGELGIRIVIDLVMNHTSDQHPWFQAARHDVRSRYRDYYIWTDSPPPVGPDEGSIFPGEETSVWTYDSVAGAYYFHRFYRFEPGLQLANPAVRDEIKRVMDFWLSFEVAGFRIDAASHMIDQKGLPSTRPADPHGILRELHQFAVSRRPHALLLGEADVDADQLAPYFGEGDELQMLFNFLLDEFVMLALARQDKGPIETVLKRLPSIPPEAQWANFLRNLDELDLERLTEEERQDVYAAFAPEPAMRIYNRGIRRRLAPMLQGDRRRIEMAFSLLFSLPGTPVIAYGDEIGMGDDLDLPEREAVRTPMQWTAGRNAGFSTAPRAQLENPVIASGPFSYRRVNVESQLADPDSFLSWMQRLIAVRRQTQAIGWGSWQPVSTDQSAVLAHICEWRSVAIMAVHNLSAKPRTALIDLGGWGVTRVDGIFGPADCKQVDGQHRVSLGPYGYGWFRLGGPSRELAGGRDV